MLATVLKSRRATEATFAIIETFAKVRFLKRELVDLQYVTWRAVGGAAVFPCILCIPWF